MSKRINGIFQLSASLIGSFAGLMVLVTLLLCTTAGAEEKIPTARPSVNGPLRVSGTVLTGQDGQEAVLRGLSTHGLTWFPGFVDEDFFRQLSTDWDCSLIRLAMYSDIYCSGEEEKEKSLALMKKGIDAAIANDMYVIADWHILSDNNPLMHKEEAADFFRMISKEYGESPNILYEICNEPNGDASWSDIQSYAKEIIPVIRENDPDSVILVGTPDYDKSLMVAARDPLPFDQVMYSCHFYTATHGDALQAELLSALEAGLPVFVTECGVSEASGGGNLDLESAQDWFSILREKGISFAVWSVCHKAETSALFRTDYDPDEMINDEALSPAGLWVRELIRGTDPRLIDPALGERKHTLAALVNDILSTAGRIGKEAVGNWPLMAAFCCGIALCFWLFGMRRRIRLYRKGRVRSYDDLLYARRSDGPQAAQGQSRIRRIIRRQNLVRIFILLSTFFTLVYLSWRILYSVPVRYGPLAVIRNIILLVVEIIGVAESLVHFVNMLNMSVYPLPEIGEEEYPDVDVFIATYNEPVELLRKTVNGCIHMKYPDKSKVHIWICDDNRRAEMRSLAQSMGVGYFDRPDNKGAKAGNLNHAMSLTSAPYIVTLDADMIPKSDFLLKTIPYFVDAEKRCLDLPPEERASLGLLQTPQCFYDPDVFQHALYCERRAPNEQDFFYRSIEVAKTVSNSVIYGGSNTVLSRRALEAAGGFYTESITEDFATGLLIESAGFLSLAIPEPLASGMTPHTFKEHIKQRTRWGRGVIVTARKLGILRRKGLTPGQKVSYWSSVNYWYSPIKNLIYMLAPLMYAVFAIPVFRCSWQEILIYWVPMFLMQEICLRLVSGNRVSTKWSGIYETGVMPHLLIPIVKEMFGISLSSFKVTDKSGGSPGRRKRDWYSMAPFLILIGLCIAGIIRVFFLFEGMMNLGFFILVFWLLRNLYFLLCSVFLIDGRGEDGEPVHVYDAETLTVQKRGTPEVMEGVTTHLTEHGISFFPDGEASLGIGDLVDVTIKTDDTEVNLSGTVIAQQRTASGASRVYAMEILDFHGMELEYLQVLYDRVPTLPQNLNRDYGVIRYLWVNIASRIGQVKG